MLPAFCIGCLDSLNVEHTLGDRIVAVSWLVKKTRSGRKVALFNASRVFSINHRQGFRMPRVATLQTVSVLILSL